MDPITAIFVGVKVVSLTKQFAERVLKLALDTKSVVKTVKEVPANLELIDLELTAINDLVQNLDNDLRKCSEEPIPLPLQDQMKTIIESGEKTMAKIDRALDPYRASGIKKHARVLFGGKEDMQELKKELRKLKTSLSFVMDMMTL